MQGNLFHRTRKREVRDIVIMAFVMEAKGNLSLFFLIHWGFNCFLLPLTFFPNQENLHNMDKERTAVQRSVDFYPNFQEDIPNGVLRNVFPVQQTQSYKHFVVAKLWVLSTLKKIISYINFLYHRLFLQLL